MFKNIAPVAPKQALATLETNLNEDQCEQLFSTKNQNRLDCADLLHSLAYESESFRCAALLLSRFAAAEPEDYNCNSTQERFTILFQMVLSGTHATLAQRLDVIDTLIKADDVSYRRIGLAALKAAFKTHSFYSGYRVDFGARSRDFGWYPQSRSEVASWISSVINYAKDTAQYSKILCDKVRKIFEQEFRTLCSHPEVIDDLANIMSELAGQKFWSQGWIAVQKVLQHDLENMPQIIAEKICALGKALEPKGLLQITRMYLSTPYWDVPKFLGDNIFDELSPQKDGELNNYVIELGRQIAVQQEIFHLLLPELTRGNLYHGFEIGAGLMQGTENVVDLWEQLVRALEETPINEQDISVLKGFLHEIACSEKKLATEILDGAIDNSVLGVWFPLLQREAGIDIDGVRRLEKSLDLGIAPIHFYRNLAYGDSLKSIPVSAFDSLVKQIASKTNGFPAAVDVFAMRLHAISETQNIIDSELILCGQDLLMNCPFEHIDETLDYQLQEIVAGCLRGETAETTAIQVCRNYRKSLLNGGLFRFSYDLFLTSLFKHQPGVALDELVGDVNADYDLFALQTKNPIDVVPTEILISWAQANPSIRFTRIASMITIFEKCENSEFEWSSAALSILNTAPDTTLVLDAFAPRFRPSGCYYGSLVDELKQRKSLLRASTENTNPVFSAWAEKMSAIIDKMIEHEQLREQAEDGGFE